MMGDVSIGVYLVFVGLIFCVQENVSQSVVTVSSSAGSISGLTQDVLTDGQTVTISKFTNIPYAESTAGLNRFEKPVPKAPFTTTFVATAATIACYQGTTSAQQRNSAYFSFSEDCLVLNIYVPHDFTTTTTPVLPVMVWIHGGGFAEGTSAFHDGSKFSAYSNVIVVTINYRLGMFGFLQSTDGELPGNQGLWDQQLALKWVHDNIAAFTGDPNLVTIFGESAGGASVILQALYPGNAGYFQRVIAESGSPLADWALTTEPNADDFIVNAGCSGAGDPVACLRTKTTSQLQSYNSPALTFYPSVDGDFLLEKPEDILFGNNTNSTAARAFYRSLDIISGVNNYESGMYMTMVYPYLLGYSDIDNPQITLAQVHTVLYHIIDTVLYPSDTATRNALFTALSGMYANIADPNDFLATRMAVVDVTNDAYFFSPAVLAAKAHAAEGNGKTYFYEFTVRTKHHVLQTPIWMKGSNHMDEIQYVYCEPLDDPNRKGKDKKKARAVATMWSNFARTGNPNTPNDVTQYIYTSWYEYELQAQNYLQIDYLMSTDSSKTNFLPNRMALWSQTIPTILNSPYIIP